MYSSPRLLGGPFWGRPGRFILTTTFLFKRQYIEIQYKYLAQKARFAHVSRYGRLHAAYLPLAMQHRYGRQKRYMQHFLYV